MLKQEVREIGGRKYQITALAAGPGRQMLVRLTKVLGPSLSAALRATAPGATFSLSSLTAGGVAGAIDELCARVEPDEFDSICLAFFKCTEVFGDRGFIPLEIYSAFSADYGNMFKLLAFHLELNYASFFEGLKNTAPQA